MPEGDSDVFEKESGRFLIPFTGSSRAAVFAVVMLMSEIALFGAYLQRRKDTAQNAE